MIDAPILQFGTSRFLQAHADLFVSEALATGAALGHIVVVQTSGAVERAARVEAFNRVRPFPVRIRGLDQGREVDHQVLVDSVVRAWSAVADWPAVVEHFVHQARVVISNTADRGYELGSDDRACAVPHVSFPAKLLALLKERYAATRAPLSLIPCELITGNASVLCRLVGDLARRWHEPGSFIEWLERECVWASSLVDRIVSESLEPLGAVAEPYALWAIESRPGLVVPCSQPAIIVTDDLARFERLKLHILNLGHSYLAEIWMKQGRPADETVGEILQDVAVHARLQALYDHEVLPIFAAFGLGEEATRYRGTVMERFANPFLRHRLSEIATNHQAKKVRRVGRLLQLANEAGMASRFPRLEALLANA